LEMVLGVGADFRVYSWDWDSSTSFDVRRTGPSILVPDLICQRHTYFN